MAAPKLNIPNSLQSIDPGVRLADVKGLADAVSRGGGYSSQDAVTASTTQTQAGGTKIAATLTNVSSANGSDAITFPKGNPGNQITIINSSGQTIQAFPFLGDAINAAGANNAVTIATATTSEYYCTLLGQWWGGATTNEA